MPGETVNIIRTGKVQFYEEDICDVKPEKHFNDLDVLHNP